jgi:hypothetical protein
MGFSIRVESVNFLRVITCSMLRHAPDPLYFSHRMALGMRWWNMVVSSRLKPAKNSWLPVRATGLRANRLGIDG